ncbi:peptidase M16 [Gemmatimonadetes bacterium T265]|nr:peptidase M16 [Gemmatimonadetes bacterium T265]
MLLAAAAAAALHVAPPAARAQAPAAAPAAAPRIAFEQYTLPNGLRVILHQDRKLPVAHVNLWYHVGSADERLGRSGFAHLYEHLMFQGSTNAGKDYLQYMERAGANLFEGGVNGTTSFDRTNYFETVPSGSLESVLWAESDRLATLADAIDRHKLDNQRDVVKNERRQGLENQPYGRAFKLIFETMFPVNHPYGHDVIGSQEDLTAASLEDVRAFFRTYYTPNNLSLVVAGDFEPAEAKRLVAKYFGPIPPGPALDRPKRMPVALSGERVVVANDRVPLARSYLAWPSPAFFDAGDAELDLAGLVLADGLTSRLQRALRYDRQLVGDLYAFQYSLERNGVFVVQATARPGASLDSVERLTSAEIARLARTGPTAEELARAKAKWELGYLTGLERIGGFGGVSDLLNQYNTWLGSPDHFAEDLARHRNATAEQVRGAVAQYLDTRNRVVVRFFPEPSERTVAAAAPLDRTREPPLAADRPFTPPTVDSTRLANGLAVYVVSRRDVPKVAATLVTRAGTVDDPAGKEGTASLAAQVMRRGTATRDALRLEDALGDLGTSLDANAGREQSTLGLEVRSGDLAPALTLLADVAEHPAWAPAELERERKVRLDRLAQEAVEPNAIARVVANVAAFGADHPYGRPEEGTPETVPGITRDDLAQWHDRRWKPGSSALVLVGDVSLADATRLAQAAFGGWSGGAAARRAPVPRARGLAAGQIYLVDRQDAAQTVVAQVLPGIPRTSPDYYALSLADAVWGGGYGTRLNLNLRQNKGYSYGIFSTPRYYTEGGTWVARGGVQTDKTKESVVEFVQEEKNLAGARPITPQELADAKAARVRGYAQAFEAGSRVAGQVATLWATGLPMTELRHEPEALGAASLDAVNAVASKYADPAHGVLVLVGDRAKIEPGVRSLNLGPVVLLDPRGRPLLTP